MKKDIFDVEISVYNGVKDVYGTTCKLRDFLFSKKHVSEIERLRSLPTKEEKNEVKKRLPMACISGLFQPTRKAENLVRHSGLICVDIDRKDNLHIVKISPFLFIFHHLTYIRKSLYYSAF